MTTASDVVALVRRTLTDWRAARYLIALLMLGELVLCALIIRVIKYTEIDWRAYMQEVEGPLIHGEWDYSKLRGATGPLVYPGGFVALYAGLRLLAGGDGTDVRPVQAVFALMYVATVGVAACCYLAARPKAVPPACLVLFSVSLRLHSIYVLRLFNDGWAMLLFWLSVLCFMRARWKSGCVAYSLAVSVKTNVLLSAPGLLVLLLQAHGVTGALGHVAICAALQLACGLPFLLHSPVSYISRCLMGFGDLNQKWSVNWKFLPAGVFHSRAFPAGLLALHLACLGLCAVHKWGGVGGDLRGRRLLPLGRRAAAAAAPGERLLLHPEHVLVTLTSCNAIGVVFWRSLHFQFYCWYLHSVPLLLWRCGASLPLPMKLGCFALLEYAWSYGLDKSEGTSTAASSAALQAAHAILLYAIWRAPSPPVYAAAEIDDDAGRRRKRE